MTMGKAPTWIAAEAALLSQCWIETSEDGTGVNGALSGSEQTTNEFWQKVMMLFESKAPSNAVVEGRYHYRGVKPIKSYWRDQIAKDCNAFNRKLMVVYSSNPTGCTELDKISMAVAIHLGKVERMEYRFKSFKPRNWKHYASWCILKSHRKFLPPSRVVAAEEEGPQPPEAPAATAPTDNAPAEATEEPAAADNSPAGDETPRALFNTPTAEKEMESGTANIAKRSRGNGAGRWKTKQEAALVEHRSKKLKAIEELTKVQQARHETNKKFLKMHRIQIKNQATYQSFMMAKAGLEANKDDDTWSEFYRDRMNEFMEQLMGGPTSNESEEESGGESGGEEEALA